jgi:predicted nucleotidyltransferase
MLAAIDYLKTIDYKDYTLDDVILTGSMANYNYHSKSDWDVHIILKPNNKEVLKPFEELLNARRLYWNLQHDIFIFGHPVEVYGETGQPILFSAGVYSLIKDEWIQKPILQQYTVDDNEIKKKYNKWKKIIDLVIQEQDIALIEKVQTKIRDYRTKGLKNGGEFSTENIVFKMLRNNDLLEKLRDEKYKLFDKELSL